MKINQLIANNIFNLEAVVPVDKSLGIAGLSGSGKTTFCQTIGEESKKRLVSLLPKSEYQYLFPNIMETNFSAIKMEEMPLVLFLGKSSISSNPRSTIGTHTGVFKEIRDVFAEEFDLSPEVFSFNNELGWCSSCKGRGTSITVCDFDNVNETRETIIDKYFTNGKYKKLTYVYEAFGYKKLVTQINKTKKSNPCPFCKGKKALSEDGLHDGVSKLTIPCVSCNASGINNEGLKELVEGIPVKTWLTGTVSEIADKNLYTKAVAEIPIFNRIRELNKKEMIAVYQCLEDKS